MTFSAASALRVIPLFLALFFLPVSPIHAQNPAVFVAFRSGTSGTATATIAAPGTGWNYSAAAPVAGTTWNQIFRPNPLIPTGTTNGGAFGSYTYSANNVVLTSGAGLATTIRLTVAINIGELETGSTRFEPTSGVGGTTNSGPGGLMGQAWRIYLSGNSATTTLTGLTPGAQFLLYVYGSVESTTGSRGG